MDGQLAPRLVLPDAAFPSGRNSRVDVNKALFFPPRSIRPLQISVGGVNICEVEMGCFRRESLCK